MKKLILISIGFSILLGSMSTAQANCAGYDINKRGLDVRNRDASAIISDVSVQKDTPVGTVIATGYASKAGVEYFGYCDGYSGDTVTGTMSYGNRELSGIAHVYKTNVSGVGIRASGYGVYLDNPTSSTAAHSGYYWADTVIVDLVAIGPITLGTVNSGTIGSFGLSSPAGLYTIYLGNSVNIKATSCSIKTPDINVKLDDVFSSELNSVGKTTKLKNFNVGLDCSASAKVNVKLTGNKNTDTSAAGVLQLTNAGSAGVAKGVGIQMLYNNSPMVLDKNVLLKTSAGGTETFTFGAQYYQTKSGVSMGSANSTATLEVTYQ